jgi:hypothetical protein
VEEIRFRESRRALPAWGVATFIVLGLAAGLMPLFVDALVAWPFLLVMVSVWMLINVLRLTVVVTGTEVRISYRPMPTKTIPGGEIQMVETQTYRPIRDYGGWGMRYSRKRGGWAYTVRGNRAVFMTLTTGKTVLVDSDTPEMLEQAISSLASER